MGDYTDEQVVNGFWSGLCAVCHEPPETDLIMSRCEKCAAVLSFDAVADHARTRELVARTVTRIECGET